MTSELILLLIRAGAMIVFALLSWLFTKYVKPWLVQNNLVTAAKVAVEAAEAMYGRYNGEEKLKAALDQLTAKGYDITSDDVLNAVRAAWLEMNTAQITSGEKETPEHNG